MPYSCFLFVMSLSYHLLTGITSLISVFFLTYFCKHCERLTLYIRVYRGTWGAWGITFSLFPLYFIFKEFNVYNVYILFKSSIYAFFLVNIHLFTVCLPCLHFQILYVYISRYCMLTLFSNVFQTFTVLN